MERPGKGQRLSLSVPPEGRLVPALFWLHPRAGLAVGRGSVLAGFDHSVAGGGGAQKLPAPWAIPSVGEAVGTRQGLGVSGLCSTSWSEVATVSPTG